MKLRTAILLGYSFLVGLLILTAALSTVGYIDLSNRVEELIEGNVAGVEAAIDMIEALERHDGALVRKVADSGGAEVDLKSAEESFRDAIRRAKRSSTEQGGDTETLVEIEDRYRAYLAARDSLLATEDPTVAGYREKVFPRFEETKMAVLNLLRTSRERLSNADGVTQKAANELAIRIGVVVAVALLALVFLSRAIQRRLVERLRQMQATVDAITTGDPRRRFAVDRRDELGNLARRFNETLDQQQELKSRLDHWREERGRLIRALLEEFERPICIFDKDGSLIATNAGDEERERAEDMLADDEALELTDSKDRLLGSLVFLD